MIISMKLELLKQFERVGASYEMLCYETFI